MREIKFTTWDKENKKIISIARIDIADGSCYAILSEILKGQISG